MDPLQSPEIADGAAEVGGVQLKGSHTTSTETDATFGELKKNVKFQDEELNSRDEEASMLKNKKKEDTKIIESRDEETFKDDQLAEGQEILKAAGRLTTDNYLQQKGQQQTATSQAAKGVTKNQPQNQNLGNENFKFHVGKKTTAADVCANQFKMQNISNERKEISKRLENIIDMFDSFSRNLETLDLKAKPKAVKPATKGRSSTKRPLNECKQQQGLEEPLRQRSRFEEHVKEDHMKSDLPDNPDAEQLKQYNTVLDGDTVPPAAVAQLQDYLEHQKMALTELENEAKALKITQSRSTSTATSSCESKSFGCQTQLADHISLHTLDLAEVSSLTSRTEQPNSLNNFATADNACVTYYSSQHDIMKQPLIQQQPLTATAVTAPEVPQFSVITIEANARPSSTDLRRTPFWQRLWEMIGDFCAATFLCLQVNRDCIFCLGFIVAFVASVSLLTAFFYHTVILSPTLWQPEDGSKF